MRPARAIPTSARIATLLLVLARADAFNLMDALLASPLFFAARIFRGRIVATPRLGRGDECSRPHEVTSVRDQRAPQVQTRARADEPRHDDQHGEGKRRAVGRVCRMAQESAGLDARRARGRAGVLRRAVPRVPPPSGSLSELTWLRYVLRADANRESRRRRGCRANSQ